jgi:hypothetical protein
VRKDNLFVATMGYLLLPNVVFAIGWLRPAWALPIVVVLLACTCDLARRSTTDTPALSLGSWCALLAFAGFWAFAAGMGELNAQTNDYLKHNLVLHDLVVESWPVVYRHEGTAGPMLCYYIAYYLPGGLLGKVLGLQHVAAASLGWGLLGIALAFAWVCRLGRTCRLAVLGTFMLVDGFCWLPGAHRLVQKLGLLAGTVNREWWHTDSLVERFWSFGGTQTRLFFQSQPAVLVWSPQHALGAWLATACVLRSLLEVQPARHAVLANAAVLLWSPLVGVGLVPFTVSACLRDRQGSVSWPNAIGGAALALPIGLYFLSHDPQEFAGVLFTTFSGVMDWMRYLLFLLLAVGILWGGAWLLQRRSELPSAVLWRLLCLASLTLVATTFVYLGKYNDWVTRVSLPALFVFDLTLASAAVELWRRGARLRHRLAFSLLLLASAERTVKTFALAPFGRLAGQGINTTIATARRYAEGLAALPRTAAFDLAGQYLGSLDSFFGRNLMKSGKGTQVVP